MKLTKKKIDEIFKNAEHTYDYLIELYKLVYQKDWDRLKQLMEFPRCSEELWKYIADKAIQFDKKHGSGFPGGLWLNNGFSVDHDITGFRVIPGKAEFS